MFRKKDRLLAEPLGHALAQVADRGIQRGRQEGRDELGEGERLVRIPHLGQRKADEFLLRRLGDDQAEAGPETRDLQLVLPRVFVRDRCALKGLVSGKVPLCGH